MLGLGPATGPGGDLPDYGQIGADLPDLVPADSNEIVTNPGVSNPGRQPGGGIDERDPDKGKAGKGKDQKGGESPLR